MKDKIVLITGASQGLGAELSRQISSLGAVVVMLARSKDLLQKLKEEITSQGGRADYFICDVTDFENVSSVVKEIAKKHGTIDVLINNAGIWLPDKVAVANPSKIESVFKTNSMGPIYFSQAVAPIFESNQSGHFVFINSIGGLDYQVIKDWQIYSASKWALTGYAKSLSYKYDSSAIKVTSIYPGPFSSNIDKNAGDDFGNDRSFEIPTVDIAAQIVNAINAPSRLQVDTLELKNTNWNQ
jgi:NADP-dependent 3-hydroxy acid dehydrogenase YdfG